jgi:hypothetical protein
MENKYISSKCRKDIKVILAINNIEIWLFLITKTQKLHFYLNKRGQKDNIAAWMKQSNIVSQHICKRNIKIIISN